MIDRRRFIGGITVCCLAGPNTARGQNLRKIHRIGIVALGAASDVAGPSPRSPTQSSFIRAMRELGYVYGDHFVIEARGSAGIVEKFPSLAAELAAAQVDVVVATGAAVPALKQATTTIPIVMAATSDPVEDGLIQSLARPGGNITGLSLQSIDTTGKRLVLIKEIVVGASPVAYLWNKPSKRHWEAAQTVAQQRGWKLLSLEIENFGEVDRAFKAALDAGAGALVVSASAILFPNRQRVVELANAYRLPAIYELRPYVEIGGLVAYGPDINDIWRRAATYVDKILKGAKPADLPVEQPTKFEMVLNLKTAKSLGLVIQPIVLAQADEVIE